MSIDRAEVLRIAELARLSLPDDQVERTAAQLSAVLDFVEALRRLDLGATEPTSFAPPAAALREDKPNGRRLEVADALAQAPAGEDGFFLVPPIVENVNP
jgi:aspartyl-tRNA(Asn)/glutamyl-tRNA(Gln) amidotransferase subunit C